MVIAATDKCLVPSLNLLKHRFHHVGECRHKNREGLLRDVVGAVGGTFLPASGWGPASRRRAPNLNRSFPRSDSVKPKSLTEWNF